MLWTLGIILGIVLLISAWLGKGSIYQSMMPVPDISTIKNKGFKVIAHRGYSSQAPENTLAAFQRALETGADMIELDVHLSKDNQVIVIHDATLKRTTGESGTVKSKTLTELKQLDAGSWFSSEFKDEPIPTLEEVIKLVDGKSTLLIEIKVDDQSKVYEGLTKEILAVIRKNHAANWCILQAFESEYLTELYQSETTIPYFKLIVNTHEPVPTYIDSKLRWGSMDKSIPFKAINPYYKTLTPMQVSQWQSQGYEVHTYTVDEAEDIKLIANMGVNGIITNYPERAMQLRDKIQQANP